jgi:polyisoprenoid-binding protein YceI
MNRRNLAVAIAAVATFALAGFFGLYFTMFNPKAVATVALPTPSPVTSTASSPSSQAGTWVVVKGSFVGYRVREKLSSLPAPSDAVGRTPAVTGTAKIVANADGTATVSGLTFRADLTQLASDSGRRDNYLRNNSLESASFPTAEFAGSGFNVPAAVVGGAAGQVTVQGRFTIHGVTKDVSIPVQLQRSGDSINAVASYRFKWGDYGVAQPSVPVASVQGDPTIEISLVLASMA